MAYRCDTSAGMRKGIEIEVTAGDRARLEAIAVDRNGR
jgi:hypothetical protein